MQSVKNATQASEIQRSLHGCPSGIREFLREPYWALKAQAELGGEPSWPIQYGYAVKRRSE